MMGSRFVRSTPRVYSNRLPCVTNDRGALGAGFVLINTKFLLCHLALDNIYCESTAVNGRDTSEVFASG